MEPLTSPSVQKTALPKQVKTVSDFSQVMKAYEGQVAQLLGNKYGMSAQEFTITCINAIKKNPKLLNCNTQSLFGAILLSAELGLRPNTPEGLAYIIPYGKDAQFQVGYKGLIEIAMRSPIVKQIIGFAVYENEFYEESESGYKHIKYTGMDINKMELVKVRANKLLSFMDADAVAKDSDEYKKRLDTGKGTVVLVYAVCYVDGKEEPIFQSVTKDVLEKIKQLSPSKQAFAGNRDVHNMMQIKAAIKKLFKFLPKTGAAQMARAIEVDDAAVMGAYPVISESGDVQLVDVDEQNKQDRNTRIAAAVNEKEAGVDQPPEEDIDLGSIMHLYEKVKSKLTDPQVRYAYHTISEKVEKEYQPLWMLLNKHSS